MDNVRIKLIEFANMLGVWIKSDVAFHIYSWLGIILALTFSAAIAINLLRRVNSFNQGDAIKTMPGMSPKTIAGIEKRIRQLEDFASSTFKSITRHALGLIFVGIIIPGILLGLIAALQNWFLPGPDILTLEGIPTSAELSYVDLALFVTDQSLRGSLSDTFEVFDLALTNVQSNPANWLYSSFILFYRFLSGTVFVAVLFVSLRIGFGMRHVRENIQMWKDKKQATQAV